MDKPNKKSPVKKIVLIVIGVIILGGIIGASTNKTGTTTQNTAPTTETSTAKAKLPLQETYDKLSKGMTKEAVEAIIGKDSGSCTVTESDYVGKMESCTYGGSIFDSGMLIITYQNDQLYNKTISKY